MKLAKVKFAVIIAAATGLLALEIVIGMQLQNETKVFAFTSVIRFHLSSGRFDVTM